MRFSLVFNATFSATLLCCAHGAFAKIADCEPLREGSLQYTSHRNYMEARDVKSGAVIWHTKLFDDVYVDQYDPAIEEDVQWDIACVRKIAGDVVVADDGKGRRFMLNKHSGILNSVIDPEKRTESIDVELYLKDGLRLQADYAYEGAIRRYKRGIAILGDSYVTTGLIDDTGQKLILAESMEKQGSKESAAKLFCRILQERFSLYKSKNAAR